MLDEVVRAAVMRGLCEEDVNRLTVSIEAGVRWQKRVDQHDLVAGFVPHDGNLRVPVLPRLPAG